MKTYVIAILLVMLATGMASAQYKINKTNYDYKTWTYEEGDPYNPTTCGILSVIPGVGQMVAGEIGRGVAYFIGCSGCFAVAIGGFSVGWGGNEALGAAMMIAGLAGMAAIDVSSIIDAVRVAKVNNLAWRDSNSTGFNLQIEPCITATRTYRPTAQFGASLKVNF